MVKLYTDPGLQNPLGDINLGTVEVGTTQQFTVYVHNETIANLIDIVIGFDPYPSGLEVVSVPKTIGPKRTEAIIIRWSPPLSLREALFTTITIKYKELYVAPRVGKR